MGSVLLPGGLQFVNSVDSLQSNLAKVQEELSSGLAVRQASDAPDQVSPILQLRANIQQNQQIQNNLNAVDAQVKTADQNLQTAGSVLNQVATLAGEGLGAGTTAQTRLTLASQVDTLVQQMVSIANTAVDGNYIFSGDSSQTPLYSYNAATASAQRLQIAAATQKIQDGSGGTFAIGLSGNQIFDARDGSDNPIPGQNVFSAMEAVSTALKANDTTGLQTAVANVRLASQYLDTQQSFYGNVENQISTALSNTNNLNVSYQKDLSNRQDANEASAILQMQQYTTTLQAAMAAQARMPQTTLFDLIGG